MKSPYRSSSSTLARELACRAVLLIALIAGVCTGRADPQIVFCAKPAGGTTHEIYTMGTNGANVVRLTTSATDKIGPVVSPDSTLVAYICAGLTSTNIQIISTNGGAPYTVPVTNHAMSLQWGDAQTLYYLSDTAAAGYRLWKIGTNGTGNALVFTNVITDYPIGPYSFYLNRRNGRAYIPGFGDAFGRAGNSSILNGRITQNRLTGIVPFTTALGDEYAPAFSPDGSALAFTADIASDGQHQLWVSAAAGGAAAAIPNSLYAGNPSWASTNSLVFVRATNSTFGATYYEGDIVFGNQNGLVNLTAGTPLAGKCAFPWVFGLATNSPGPGPGPALVNDNFTNAIIISEIWGTTNVDTTSATAEPGEPDHAGAPAANSVWFKFIPIQDGTVVMHTIGSAAAIDTRLAVYTLAANTNVAVSSPLFPVTANDDFGLLYNPMMPALAGPNGPAVTAGASAVRFPAKRGTVYYVAVDSNGGGGQIQLTWGYNFAGMFYMTKTYVEGSKNNEGVIEFSVGRAFGCAGQVEVDVITAPYAGELGDFTPATEGEDYFPIPAARPQTLVFDNYETWQSFTVTLAAPPANYRGPVPPQTNPPALPFNPNYYFDVQILAVRFNALENTNVIAPPVIIPGEGVSTGRILEDNIPFGSGDIPAPGFPVLGVPTNIVNFAIKHQVTDEQVGDGDGYAHVVLTRNGNGDPSQNVSVVLGTDSLISLGDNENNGFDLWPESDYAVPYPANTPPPGADPVDFGGGAIQVSWGSYDFNPKTIYVPINPGTKPKFNKDLVLDIVRNENCMVGEIGQSIVTIAYDGANQPAGALESFYNSHTEPPGNPHPGANAVVLAMVTQPDQKAVIGGGFTAYNAMLRNRIARVNSDGTLDQTFNPGNGADGLVTSLALQNNGSILMGGDFRSVNGINRYRVARLQPDGGVDVLFNPGVGADDTVWSLALGASNSVIVVGQFNNFNNYPRSHVARLDSSGNVDLTFDTSNLGIDGTIWAVAVESDGKVIIGGDFTTVGGFLRSRIARLNNDGSLDTTFDPGLGANDTVYTLEASGSILVGGAFTQFHTSTHRGLTRLLPNGTVDPTFVPGSGANGVVYSIFMSPTDGKIYIGGSFTTYSDTRRIGLARLFTDGTVDTSFLDPAYNQFAGLSNPLFNPDLYPQNVVYAMGVQYVFSTQLDFVEDILIAGSFNRVTGGGPDRRSYDDRENLALLVGGSTVGPGNILVTKPNYSVDENGANLWAALTRTNGTLGTVGARFSPDPSPVGPGAAVYGKDYTYDPVAGGLSVWASTWGPPGGGTRMLSDGIYWRTYPDPQSVLPDDIGVLPFNNANVDIVDNAIVDDNRSFNLNLTIPWQGDTFFLGGADMPLATALGPMTSASSLIVNNENLPGTFTFITTNYTVSETAGTASIMVIRTNGSSDTVTMKYFTYDMSGTPPAGIGFARSNVNYYATSGTLTFYPGITNQSFTVRIRPDGHIDPDLALLVVITNIVAQHPVNGTALGGITNAWLTIIDGDFPQGRLNFSATSFATEETAGNARITVTRTAGSQGAMSVLCSTTNTFASSTNTPAVPGVNYLPVTNVLLSWTNGESNPKTFTVPVLHDFQITSNLTVGLALSRPILNGVTNYQALGPFSNSVLNILNVDALGALSFSSPTYAQNESGGYAIVPVVRQGGSVGTLSVNFNANIGLNAVPGVDFFPTNGTLVFGPGEVSKVFTVPIIDGHHLDLSNRAVVLQLTNPAPSGTLIAPSTALLNIVSDGYNVPPGGSDPTFIPVFNGAVNAVAVQPNGDIVAGGAFTVVNSVTRNRLTRLSPDGALDFGFAALPGQANDVVRALGLQTDGRILIGGDFTTYDGHNRGHLARVNLDGTLDWQFDPGSALDHSVYSVVETFTDTNKTVRKVLVGGSFTLANGAPRHYLAQFNDDGSIDLSVNADNGAGGIDGPVWAVAVQTDRKIVIGGDFVTINGAAHNHIARLYPDGSLDNGFNNPGSGAGDSVRAITIQLDGRILVGGLFTNFNGTVQNHLVRLNADGSLDPTFNAGVGADNDVYAIALQPDNRILLGGAFTLFSGVTRKGMTRLNADGSVDPTINFGGGFNNYVTSLVVQTNDSIVVGGGFTRLDDAPAPYLARVYGRSVAGSGTFEFTSAIYGGDETASNIVVTVRRRGGTSPTTNGPNVYVTVATSDGVPPDGATNGINYIGGVFTNTFPPGETFQSIRITPLHDFQVTSDLSANLLLTDVQPLGLAGLGNQPNATLFITNVDSGVHFSSATYSIAKNDQAGRATIPIYRFGSTVGISTVDFMTTTNGTAVPFGRYDPVTNTVIFNPGQTAQNVFIPIHNDSQVLGDQTVTMILASPTNTLLSTPAAATLTIVENSTAAGTISFSAPSYVVSEAATNAYFNVVRANGVTGVVTVNYFTRDGTALAGARYSATNGALIFASGETNKTIVVPIINTTTVEGDQTFSVVLTNATGGATLRSPSTALVTIIDDDVGLSFTAPIYVVSEAAGSVSLSVFRQNGTNATTTVHYATTNLTASAGTNYVANTNGTLTFGPGETLKSFSIGVLHDPRVTGDLSFGVNLSNPSAPAQIFNYGSAVVNIRDADPGLSFGSTNLVVITNNDLSTVITAGYGVLKSGTNVLITVLRSNANTGTVSVNYTTLTNATDNAVPGQDYTTTSGLLTFSNGITLQSFVVPIVNNRQVTSDHTFSINLFNPTGGAQLIPPSVATVTITNDVAGISFSAGDYRVNENGGAATITVLRTGYTNSTVSVDYATAGTPQSGINYSNASGTLTFNPGETVKTFVVPVIDDGVLNGDVVVPLSLGNLVGNAVLVNPSAATLTIVETDGSLIVPAGAALTAESGPVNGVIDPGETVTLLFALRDSTGTNTGNLVATLLATNGITQPSGPQTYGALVVHGPSVSRSFSFTASGTNGQTIGATFQLQDGNINRGLALFSFSLGQTATNFANPGVIVINDKTNATPYPSMINVHGLGGVVSKPTVTLSNLNHTWPSDINALLVSPTGQKSYLMAKCGSSFPLNNVTLTFDDSAAANLPHFSAITSGTNRPTSYSVASSFPPTLTPAPPYYTNLSVFNGYNPNGDWSLYVIDDSLGNFGAISNGWSLNLSTAGVVQPAADVGLAMTAAPAIAVVTSNVTYTLTLTNYGPAGASNIVVTNALPPGTVFVSATPSPGTVSNNAGLITWAVSSLAKDAVARLTLVLQTTTIGTLSNSATVMTGTADLNPADDTATAVVAVVAPAADLVLSLGDSPDPVQLGNYVTYTITVANAGPATASGVVVVDALPSTMNFISASPANSFIVSFGVVTFTNLGSVASGGLTNVTIVAQATALGTVTDAATCRSDIVDPFKANNSASVKTIVQSVPLSVSRAGNSLVITWPANQGNLIVQSTVDLRAPTVWTPVAGANPVLVGAQMVVVLPIGPVNQYFRLVGSP
jgi:uncharacterized repeat protein (TIGR01451 family)/uncharacterized delta-60 repeat protein